MPSENWFRDDNFVPGAYKIANMIMRKYWSLLRSEQALASTMTRDNLWKRSLCLFVAC